MKKILFFLLINSFVLSALAFGKTDLGLDVDWASFRASDSNVYLEVYYEINKSVLEYAKVENDKFVGGVLCNLQIIRPKSLLHKLEEVVVDKIWRLNSTVADTTQLREANDKMVDMLRFELQQGKYKIRFLAKDLNNAAKLDSVIKKIKLKSFQDDKLSMSNIQLGSSITKSAGVKDSLFHKNTYTVIPNPSLLYGKDRPNLYYYLECYHIAKNKKTEYFKTTSYITDSQGIRLDSPGVRTKKKKVMKHSVEVGLVNVASMATGKYAFHFNIVDERNEIMAHGEKDFYIYNPSVAKHVYKTTEFQSKIAQSVFADMTEKELGKELDQIRYIQTKEEKKLIKALNTVEGKREFLWAFWSRHDSERETYLEKVNYANEHFRSLTRDGWRTERGRVYIQYGPPTDIDVFHNTSDTYAYEIWNYNLVENGALFVFGDRRGVGEWDLLHSNVTGEIINERWREFLRKL